MTSTNGIGWTVGSTPADNSWTSVAFGGGRFVAVATSSINRFNRVMTSPDLSAPPAVASITDDDPAPADRGQLEALVCLEDFIRAGEPRNGCVDKILAGAVGFRLPNWYQHELAAGTNHSMNRPDSPRQCCAVNGVVAVGSVTVP